jgi:hypothetical protein
MEDFKEIARDLRDLVKKLPEANGAAQSLRDVNCPESFILKADDRQFRGIVF